MEYTKRNIVVSQSRVAAAEERVERQRRMVHRIERESDPATDAIARLLVMEQSLLLMRRFLGTLQQDLEQSLGTGESRRRAKALGTDVVAPPAPDADSGLVGNGESDR